MTIEALHGRCRVCGFGPVDVRTGSQGWAKWEACPACGFVLLDDPNGDWPDDNEFWTILTGSEDPERGRLVLYAAALFRTEITDPVIDKRYPSIFATNHAIRDRAAAHREKIARGEVKVFTPADVTREVLEEAFQRYLMFVTKEEAARFLYEEASDQPEPLTKPN